MKKLKYLLFLFTFLLITDVNAADSWTGTNWASNSPSRIEVFGYRNENGTITYPYSSYQPVSVSAFNFNGYRANGWNGYAFNQSSGTGYSLTQYTNSFNLIYNNYSFTSGGDYVTLKGQIMPSNQVGIDILKNLSWYITANYGSSNVSDCVTNTGEVDNMYFANFECSFPRTNSLVISLHFNNYTTYNQGAQFMIRNDYSDVMYSNDNTSIITGSIGGASQGIINNQNQNTQDIINNNSGNTQDIINNQNQNKQDIIDNQNQNTDKEIESQKVCTTIIIDKSKGIQDGYLNNRGVISSTNPEYTTSDYIEINQNTSLKGITGNYTDRLCFYNSNKVFISCLEQVPSTTISIPLNSKYFRLTIVKSSNLPQIEMTTCQNGNQALNDSVTGLNDNITNSNTDNPSSDFSNFQNMLPENGVITQLITLPISLFQKILSSLNATCSNFNLGSLYNHELILPCINISNYVGSSLWNVIDVLFSGFFVLVIAKKMIATFENFSSMKEGDILD